MSTADQNMEDLFRTLQREVEEVMETPAPQNTPVPQEPQQKPTNGTGSPRDELINLAESGKIKYSANYIKKASGETLEKIKVDYERKHLEETNDYMADSVLSSLTQLLKHFSLIKNSDELEHDLKENYLLKRDVKNIIGIVTPSIPYVGLLCGGVTVGKHVAMNALDGETTAVKPNVPDEVKST